MKITPRIIIIILLLSGCSVVKNQPQESKYMKVLGGGYFVDSEKQKEETYGFIPLPINSLKITESNLSI